MKNYCLLKQPQILHLQQYMRTLTINLPESLKLNESEIITFLACKLYEKGSLSLGQAAEMAGVAKREFMDMLGNYDVSIFNYDTDELDNDVLLSGKGNL